MAVAKMLKIQLIAHNTLRDSLIYTLQENGFLQITSTEKSSGETQLKHKDYDEQIESLRELLASIESALDFINSHHEEKKGFIATMIPRKINIKKQAFFKIEEKLGLHETLEKLSTLEIRLQETRSKIDELTKIKKELFPWKDFKISPLIKFKNVDILTGAILPSKLEFLNNMLEKEVGYCEIVKVSETLGRVYAAVLSHKKYENEVKNILNNQGFQSINLPVESIDTDCHKAYSNAEKQLSELDKSLLAIKKELKEFFKIKDDLIIAEALVENKLNRLLIQKHFTNTNQAILIEGWIPQKEKNKVEMVLNELGKEIDYMFFEPTKDDNPPIILENPFWLKPLESVTTLYGYPSYWEKDPTAYLAPFFLIFFGLSIGDVGYGIIICFLAWILKRTLNVSDKSKQFLKLFIYGGLASIPVGVLTGSWLALDPKYLPKFIQNMAITNPMKNPMPLLIFCLGLGFIHLYWGVIIEMVDGFKDNVIHSLMDNFPILLFLPGLLIIIILAFYSTSGFSPSWSPFAKWFALAGAGSVIIFTNRKGKSILSKIGGGLYNLYGLSSFIGDTISYARLMALGIATFLIGQSINLMAKLFLSIFGLFFGIIVAAIIIVIGHLFNIVINLIGAFIHPARLQYVEFFTKFFEGGGQHFQPFKLESKNLDFE